MPFCPKCGTEYREGFTECADCHVPLAARPPEPPPHPEAAITDPQVVYETGDAVAAAMICDILRNAGIAAITRESDALGEAVKLYTGSSFLGVHILVDRAQAAQASEMLRVWAAQDARSPVSEEELARLALEDLSEEELAREAAQAQPRPVEGNAAYGALKWVVAGVLVAALLLWFVAGRL